MSKQKERSDLLRAYENGTLPLYVQPLSPEKRGELLIWLTKKGHPAFDVLFPLTPSANRKFSVSKISAWLQSSRPQTALLGLLPLLRCQNKGPLWSDLTNVAHPLSVAAACYRVLALRDDPPHLALSWITSHPREFVQVAQKMARHELECFSPSRTMHTAACAWQLEGLFHVEPPIREEVLSALTPDAVYRAVACSIDPLHATGLSNLNVPFLLPSLKRLCASLHACVSGIEKPNIKDVCTMEDLGLPKAYTNHKMSVVQSLKTLERWLELFPQWNITELEGLSVYAQQVGHFPILTARATQSVLRQHVGSGGMPRVKMM